MEEVNAETAAQIDKALKSFACLLYVGKSRPLYKAQPWNNDDFYLQGKYMRDLEILATNKKTELVPIDKIKLAMDSKLIRRPETLMFALAMCARQKKSEKLRASAYYFLAEHCKEWKYFILFIKYASYLCKVEGSKDKDTDNKDGDKDEVKKPIGWGHGWKNAVNKWYFTKDVAELAQLVTRYKGNHGWTHRDILKLSHPESSSLEVEKQAIVCYVMNGLEAAQKEFDSDPEAKKTLLYIRRVEEFKKCQDTEVLTQIETYKYTIDYVHPMALKQKNVWITLLKEMDVRTILNNLPKLHQLGILTKLGWATSHIVKSLTTEENLKWNSVLPAEILIVLSKYESALTPKISLKMKQSLEPKPGESETTVKALSSKKTKLATIGSNNQAKNKPNAARPVKGSIETKEPDTRIRDALRTALNISQTVDITGSSKRRYLVSVRLPSRRRSNSCAEAGLALALPLLHRDDLPEDAVTIMGYEPRAGNRDGGRPLPITRDMSFDDAIQILNTSGNLLPMPIDPWQWALAEKKSYDVFINVTNEPPTKDCIDIVQRYRKHMKLPDARLINVIINRVPFELKHEDWNHSLVINGFDRHVPWIIEAYVRGLF